MAPIERLVTQAFARFGPSLLWNLRAPQGVPDGRMDGRTARAVARRLTREGGAEAVRLGWAIADEVDAADARSLPGRGDDPPRREPVGG